MQEALIAAADQWPREGVPDNPRGWLIHVALRRSADYARSDISRRNREAAVASESPLVAAPTMEEESAIDSDDTLVLLFMCCHPALTPATAIALTLRAVGGLTTAEIAKAFLVPESTIGQRISRAEDHEPAGANLPPDEGGARQPLNFLGYLRQRPSMTVMRRVFTSASPTWMA